MSLYYNLTPEYYDSLQRRIKELEDEVNWKTRVIEMRDKALNDHTLLRKHDADTYNEKIRQLVRDKNRLEIKCKKLNNGRKRWKQYCQCRGIKEYSEIKQSRDDLRKENQLLQRECNNFTRELTELVERLYDKNREVAGLKEENQRLRAKGNKEVIHLYPQMMPIFKWVQKQLQEENKRLRSSIFPAANYLYFTKGKENDAKETNTNTLKLGGRVVDIPDNCESKPIQLNLPYPYEIWGVILGN